MLETPPIPSGLQLIQGYEAGGFTIGGVNHRGSVLVFPDRTLAWDVGHLDEVTPASLEPIRTARPAIEILLVGTGARFELVSPTLRELIRSWGPAVEPMATPAACRTYNVLLAEGRRVAAMLIAMPA